MEKIKWDNILQHDFYNYDSIITNASVENGYFSRLLTVVINGTNG